MLGGQLPYMNAYLKFERGVKMVEKIHPDTKKQNKKEGAKWGKTRRGNWLWRSQSGCLFWWFFCKNEKNRD